MVRVVAPPGEAHRPHGMYLRRVCSVTGLALIRSTGKSAWRVAKTSYGPLNPVPRQPGADRSDWNRYDVEGSRTIYAAAPKAAAYAESLAWMRTGLDQSLGQLFDRTADDYFDGGQDLLDEVENEWIQMGLHRPGTLNAGWRQRRALYRVGLPEVGWFIDIQDAESLAILRRNLAAPLRAFGVSTLTVAHLTGEDRNVTTTVAKWLFGVKLEGGQRPHGVMYSSKHSTNWTCWAVWLRNAGADGTHSRGDFVTAGAGAEIGPCERNPDLQHAVRVLDLNCY